MTTAESTSGEDRAKTVNPGPRSDQENGSTRAWVAEQVNPGPGGAGEFDESLAEQISPGPNEDSVPTSDAVSRAEQTNPGPKDA